MTDTKAQPRRGAHLLLLALLLYVGGLAVEPVLHAAESAALSSDLVATGGEQPAESPAGDHECSLCKLTRVFSSTAAAAAAAFETTTYVPAPVLTDLQARGPPVLAASQPRAPPTA